jgi:hypothetical protein
MGSPQHVETVQSTGDVNRKPEPLTAESIEARIARFIAIAGVKVQGEGFSM